MVSIQNNITAMNSQRNMGVASAKSANAMEKLSTGFRINRAADDAAGLAISQKMRSQIRGLNQASSNAADGISLIQTAEGALNTTHDILERLGELATQSANGTYTDDDRVAIQEEVNQLLEDIDRISTDTEFNTMKLLNGNLSSNGVGGKDTILGGKMELGNENNILPGGMKLDMTSAGMTASLVDAYMASSVNGTADMSAGKIEIRFGEGANDVIKLDFAGILSDATAGDAIKSIKDFEAEINSELKRNGINLEASFAIGSNSLALSFESNGELTSKDVKLEIDVTGGLKTLFGNDKFVQTFEPKELVGIRGTHKAESANVISGGQAIGGLGSVTVMISLDSGKVISLNTAVMASVTASADAAHMAGNLEKLQDDLNKELADYGLEAKITWKDGEKASLEIVAKEDAQFTEGFTVKTDSNGSAATWFADKTTSFTAVPQPEPEGANLENAIGGMTLHVGANENQLIKFEINEISTKTLKIDRLKLDQQDSAESAITTIQEATKKVSMERAKLGAVQNRLDYAITNLDTTSENLSSSESQIRDADMAAEVLKQTQYNVLQQAAQSMMAQANQRPQQVLQLLG